ncbi:macrolide-specific efflux protein [Bdellovibrio bacteriovorus W]|nr:macrolide-specific efflux protein [Bdellovibrio bacteriovorus W]
MKNKKIIISILVLLLIGFGYWLYPKKEKLEYREVIVSQQDIDLRILTTGKVSPENRVEIKPPVAGRIEEVLVKEGQAVRKGQVLAWMSSSERAALIDAARARGPDEQKIWEDLYKATPIMAPISGVIILRNVESGQSFTTADAVLVISDRLTVEAVFDETDLASIHAGQSAEVRLDAYANEVIQAKITRISYEAKTTNNVTTYTAYVLPENPPDFMRSGMTANVSVLVESKKDVVAVPNSFIKNIKGKSVVTVKAQDGALETRELQLGLSDGRVTEVVNGLAAGAILVEEKQKQDDSSRGASPFGPQPRGRRR